MTCTPHRTLLRRPWAVWLAVLIAVFSALAPTVSHALALAYRVAPMEASYCSSMGGVDAVSDVSDGQGVASALVHCPFCLHVTDRLAPLPQPVVCPLLVQDRSPQTTDSQPRGIADVSIWEPLPRGPPVIFSAL